MAVAFFEWIGSTATIDNIGAGLIVMAVELSLILLLINRVVAAAQERNEHRKWRRARAVILANATHAAHNFSLIALTGYRGFPWPPIGDYWAEIERAARAPAALELKDICIAVPDIERDAASLREALGLYSAALPAQWFETMARILDAAVAAGRVSNNIRTSRAYAVMPDLKTLALQAPFDDDHFAPLDALDGALAPGEESLKARMLRRWIGLLDVIIRLNALTEQLGKDASNDILRRLPKEDRIRFDRHHERLPALREILQSLRDATDPAFLYYAGLTPEEAAQRRSV